MMAKPLTLEEFVPGRAVGDPADTRVLAEEARLAVYEEGYKAGWDDAVDAEEQAQTRISADFAKSLQEISFSFHEARDHVLSSITPLLSLIAEKILPELARETFAETIAEAVREAAEEAAGEPLELVLNPANRAAVEAILSDAVSFPLRVVEEASLGPGQAYIRAPKAERSVDLDRALGEIETAIKAFMAASDQQGMTASA